jgi:cell cycle sensor histidine kinase DivJ
MGRRGGDRAAVALRKFARLEPVKAYIDGLVHPSARADAHAAARHRSFIAVRLLGALLLLAAVPLQVAWRGAPSAVEALIVAWLVAPLAVAWYLSRTGNLERAHVLSVGLLGALVATVAGISGGITSFAAPWFALLPLEAALSSSRRVILLATLLAAALLLGLWGLGSLAVLPPVRVDSSVAYALSALSGALYAAAISLGVGHLVRHGDQIRLRVEARYHLLARSMTDVVTRHSRNGAVTFISPAAERLLAVSPASLMGHGWFEAVHVADRPRYVSALSAAARGQASSVEYRVRQGCDGEATGCSPAFTWVEMRCRALRRESAGDEELGDVVAVTRDISRNKADADALAAARSEAERGEEANNRFLATVSHELRTPLNAIVGFSELLTSELARAESARAPEYARLIRDAGQHLLGVVNGILDVSRIEAGAFDLSPESIAVAPLIDGCCEMLRLRAEQAGVGVHARCSPDLPDIVADQLAMRQILINVLSNAIKFTPRGGRVDLHARVENDELLIAIADTGIGIAECDLPQIGRPFFRARSSYDRPCEGTGLGLSVVNRLIDLHGGRLEIKSRLGEGTRALIRLPLVADVAKAQSQSRVIAFPIATAPAARLEPMERVQLRA